MSAESVNSTMQALETLISGLPLSHAWRMSLWCNFLNDPTYAQIEQRFGLLRDDVNILYCLSVCGDLTATVICSLTGRPKNSVSRAVERLHQRRLLTRRVDPEDRRRSLLTVEQAGREMSGQILPFFVAREKLMLASLDQTDLAELDRILAKLMNAMPDWRVEF